MAAGVRIDGRIERGNQTRRLILSKAADIASVEGLEGLSLGRLAAELELSKSGVFALFGSKEELQLATVRAAVKIFLENVVNPAREAPPGLGQVWSMCLHWLDYSKNRIFPGGCFFYSVTAEFDARRGPLHDTVAQAQANWINFIEQTIAEACRLGEAEPDTDVGQLSFELIALMEAANGDSVLRDEHSSYAKAAKGILSRLRAVAVHPDTLPEAP